MPTDLSRHILRLIAALLKHQARQWLGEAFMDAAGDVLADLGAERVEEALNRWLEEKETAAQLLQAARRADAYFLQHCDDPALRQAFTLNFGALPSVQAALAELPQAMGPEGVEAALREALARDLGRQLSEEQIVGGARLYAEALLAALLPLRDYALPLIGQMLLAMRREVRRDLGEVSAKLDLILQQLARGVALSDEETRTLGAAIVQGRVFVEGDVQSSVVIIGTGNTVTLSGDVLRRLRKTVTLPGDLPPNSHLPFPRNRFFTGRAESLRDLAQALLRDGGAPAGVLIGQALTGMGGVGKSQLALEFAYRYGYRFRGVHWLDLRDPALLDEQIAAYGRRMGIPAETHDELVEATLECWKSDGPRLLILDNFEEAAAANRVFSRLHHSALRLLITSRRADWPPALPLGRLSLQEFTPQESREFLRRYLPPERAADADLGALAERLGRLPLALELAARYLAQLKGLSVADYLGELDRALDHPSMDNWRPDLPTLTSHDLSLLQTFALSYKRVTNRNARRFFRLAGCLAPNAPIPPEIPERALGLAGREVQAAGALLEGLGLLKEGPAIHPLLAEFARRLDEGSALLPPLAGALDDLATETNQQVDRTGNYALFAPLLPHVRAVAEYAEQAGLAGAGRLWNSLGYHLHSLADYRGARECYERALRIDEAAFGPDHPNVARDVNNLGSVLQALGDLAGARRCLERALRIGEATFGPDHPQVATYVNNLGEVLRALGDLAGARECLERALRIDEAAFGPDHPNVAIRVNNLGSVLWALGDLAGARECLERALRIDQAAFGPDHPNVARDVNNLGRVLQALGDLAGARACFERALRILERSLPPDHPPIQTVRENLRTLQR